MQRARGDTGRPRWCGARQHQYYFVCTRLSGAMREVLYNCKRQISYHRLGIRMWCILDAYGAFFWMFPSVNPFIYNPMTMNQKGAPYIWSQWQRLWSVVCTMRRRRQQPCLLWNRSQWDRIPTNVVQSRMHRIAQEKDESLSERKKRLIKKKEKWLLHRTLPRIIVYWFVISYVVLDII